jgi:hypothetical protein
VWIEDAHGNIVVGDNTTNVTIAIGNNPAGGTLSGTTLNTAASGVVTFNNLSINFPGAGYSLTASSIGLTGAASDTFNVTGTLPTSPNPNSQLSTLENPRYPSPDMGQMTTYQINVVNPSAGGGVYFYQPLTPYDMAAFNAMILDANAYSFMNGSINLVGHEGLMSMFDEFRSRGPNQ